jgi:hypothetical protein
MQRTTVAWRQLCSLYFFANLPIRAAAACALLMLCVTREDACGASIADTARPNKSSDASNPPDIAWVAKLELSL